MPARSVCLVTLSLSEAGPGRFGRQVSVTDIYHTIPYHTVGSFQRAPNALRATGKAFNSKALPQPSSHDSAALTPC